MNDDIQKAIVRYWKKKRLGLGQERAFGDAKGRYTFGTLQLRFIDYQTGTLKGVRLHLNMTRYEVCITTDTSPVEKRVQTAQNPVADQSAPAGRFNSRDRNPLTHSPMTDRSRAPLASLTFPLS